MSNPQISICIITLGRKTIYDTLLSIFSQLIDVEYEIVIILQGKLQKDVIDLINTYNISVTIHNYPSNLGFGYYRNKSIEHARGTILAWIDDDERTYDYNWLNYLTKPIRERHYKVVTSGCRIPLGQGYLTDCISLMGYPGGGSLGFDKVWRVEKNSTTKHLCGGNFAVSRDFLNTINNFEEKCVHSCDDTHLAGKINNLNALIYYEKRSTLYHIPRYLRDLPGWIISRRKGVKDYQKIRNNKALFSDKIHHFISIFQFLLKRPKYIPGIIIIILYICFLFIKTE